MLLKLDKEKLKEKRKKKKYINDLEIIRQLNKKGKKYKDHGLDILELPNLKGFDKNKKTGKANNYK